MSITVEELNNMERTRAELVNRFQKEIGKLTSEKQNAEAEKEKSISAGDIAGAADAISKLSILSAKIEAAQEILNRQITEPLYTVDVLVDCVNGLIDGESAKIATLMKNAEDQKAKYYSALKKAIVAKNHLIAQCHRVLHRSEDVKFFMGTPRVNGMKQFPKLPDTREFRVNFKGLDNDAYLNALEDAAKMTCGYNAYLESENND